MKYIYDQFDFYLKEAIKQTDTKQLLAFLKRPHVTTEQLEFIQYVIVEIGAVQMMHVFLDYFTNCQAAQEVSPQYLNILVEDLLSKFLDYASRLGRISIVQHILCNYRLDKYSEIDLIDYLNSAVRFNQVDFVLYMLSIPVQPSFWTVIDAMGKRNSVIFKILVPYFKYIPHPDHWMGFACEFGFLDGILFMLEHDCELKSEYISIVCNNGYVDCLQALLQAGCPINKDAFYYCKYNYKHKKEKVKFKQCLDLIEEAKAKGLKIQSGNLQPECYKCCVIC